MQPKKFGVSAGSGIPNYSYDNGQRQVKVLGVVSEINARYGVIDQLDVGTTIRIIGASGIDLKYQFYGDHESKYAVAVGTEFGFFFIPTRYQDVNTFEMTIPAFLGYYPSENFALYINPKYVYRKYGSIETTSFWGATGGARMGDDVGFFVEYGFLWNRSSDWSNQRQLNIGISKEIR